MAGIFWEIDETKILSLTEVRACLDDMEDRIYISSYGRACHYAWNQLSLFRLAVGCGLRKIEIRKLQLRDFTWGSRPCITIRPEATKSRRGEPVGRARRIPLWWDRGTHDDLRDIWHHRVDNCGFTPEMPFHCRWWAKNIRPFCQRALEDQWTSAIQVLGPERRKQLWLHTGRHTFCSHALHAGRTLVEVQRAAGHSSVSMTGKYLHVMESDDARDLYSRERVKSTRQVWV